MLRALAFCARAYVKFKSSGTVTWKLFITWAMPMLYIDGKSNTSEQKSNRKYLNNHTKSKSCFKFFMPSGLDTHTHNCCCLAEGRMSIWQSKHSAARPQIETNFVGETYIYEKIWERHFRAASAEKVIFMCKTLAHM